MFQTFQEAKSLALPYIFKLHSFEVCEDAAEVGEQTLTNKITNEELSIRKMDGDKKIEIKRAAKKRKN